MSIVGHQPETGVRIDVQRSLDGQPPWRYRGEAVTADARVPLVAVVSAEGDVAIELPPGAAPALRDKVRLIMRAAWKHAHQDGAPPPRRILRWRPDRD